MNLAMAKTIGEKLLKDELGNYIYVLFESVTNRICNRLDKLEEAAERQAQREKAKDDLILEMSKNVDQLVVEKREENSIAELKRKLGIPWKDVLTAVNVLTDPELREEMKQHLLSTVKNTSHIYGQNWLRAVWDKEFQCKLFLDKHLT
jgi:crotonobetainyl-CoA:carnitine CoA-transferase CaiB-like acyl-CoA transferase